MVEPTEEGHALVLAQGGVCIHECFDESEHERVTQTIRGKLAHQALAAEVLEHSCEPRLNLCGLNPTRGPPLRMEASPLGSHLPGKEGGILKETSMILLTPQHQVCPAPRNFASCCFMHATAVRSTNQQPPDGERARDTAQNRVP